MPTSSTAGYSGTPLHRKLGIKPGHRVLAVGVPAGWDTSQLDPEGRASVTARRTLRALAAPVDPPYDVMLAFCPDSSALEPVFTARARLVAQTGRLWVCWPKKASGVATDLDDNVIRAHGLASGVVDVKVCAVDHVWSGECFMTRLRDRT